jgi:hypothetical protein
MCLEYLPCLIYKRAIIKILKTVVEIYPSFYISMEIVSHMKRRTQTLGGGEGKCVCELVPGAGRIVVRLETDGC